MAWLEADRGEYDLIFIDPPTFSNPSAWRACSTCSVTTLHCSTWRWRGWLPAGRCISNNFRKFVLDASLMDRYAVEEITASTLDEDFRRNLNPPCLETQAR